MDSSAATFSPYPSQVQSLVVDGEAVGTHSLNHSRLYTAWARVGSLPAFALSIGEEIDDQLFGPRQKTRSAKLNELAAIHGTGFGLAAALFPADSNILPLVSLKDTWVRALCAEGQLQLDVLAPEDRHIESAIELAKLLVRRANYLAASRRAWTKAFAGEEPPEEEVDAELIELLEEKLEEESAWVAGDAERHNNEMVVRCGLEGFGETLAGEIAVQWLKPDLTALRLRAHFWLPTETCPRVGLIPEARGLRGWWRSLGELTLGDPTVDAAWNIRADAQASTTLRAMTGALGGLAPHRPEIDLYAAHLALRLGAEHRMREVLDVYARALDLWQAAARAVTERA